MKKMSKTPSFQWGVKKIGMLFVVLLLVGLGLLMMRLSNQLADLSITTESDAAGLRRNNRNPVRPGDPVNPPESDQPPGNSGIKLEPILKCGDDCTRNTANLCPAGTKCTYLGLTAMKCVDANKTCPNPNVVGSGGKTELKINAKKCGEVCSGSSGYAQTSPCETGTTCMTAPGAAGYLQQRRCYSGKWGTCSAKPENSGGIENPVQPGTGN